MTKREIIMAKREGYAECLMRVLGWSYDDAFDEAARRYPTPKKKVPNVKILSSGVEYKCEHGKVFSRPVLGCLWQASVYTEEDIKMLEDMIDNPTIEVDDD